MCRITVSVTYTVHMSNSFENKSLDSVTLIHLTTIKYKNYSNS